MSNLIKFPRNKGKLNLLKRIRDLQKIFQQVFNFPIFSSFYCLGNFQSIRENMSFKQHKTLSFPESCVLVSCVERHLHQIKTPAKAREWSKYCHTIRTLTFLFRKSRIARNYNITICLEGNELVLDFKESRFSYIFLWGIVGAWRLMACLDIWR